MSDTEELEKADFEAFNQFIMHVMQSSEETTKSQSAIKHQIINFYLAIFTALIGGAVFVITNVANSQLKLSILTLDLAVTSGFGMLSFATILNTIVVSVREGFLRVFLYKYFRDLNPLAFEKYGLAELLSWYKKAFDRKSYIQFVDILALLSLATFSSCLIGGATYTLSSVIWGSGNVPLSIIMGFACFAFAGILWVRALKTITNKKDESLKLYKKYHIEIESTQLPHQPNPSK